MHFTQNQSGNFSITPRNSIIHERVHYALYITVRREWAEC